MFLTNLDFSHCQIGDEGCLAIAAARPSALRWLSIEHSRATEVGVKALQQALPELRVTSA